MSSLGEPTLKRKKKKKRIFHFQSQNALKTQEAIIMTHDWPGKETQKDNFIFIFNLQLSRIMLTLESSACQCWDAVFLYEECCLIAKESKQGVTILSIWVMCSQLNSRTISLFLQYEKLKKLVTYIVTLKVIYFQLISLNLCFFNNDTNTFLLL